MKWLAALLAGERPENIDPRISLQYGTIVLALLLVCVLLALCAAWAWMAAVLVGHATTAASLEVSYATMLAIALPVSCAGYSAWFYWFVTRGPSFWHAKPASRIDT